MASQAPQSLPAISQPPQTSNIGYMGSQPMSMGYQPYNMQVKRPSLHWAWRAITDRSSPPGSHFCFLPARRVCFCLVTDYSVLGSILLPTESHDHPSRPGRVSASPATLHHRAAARVPAGEPSPGHLPLDRCASSDPLH